MIHITRLLFLVFLGTILTALEVDELPANVIKAETTHATMVEKAMAKARKDIESSKEKLIKSLKRELKNTMRRGDLPIAEILQSRIEALEKDDEAQNNQDMQLDIFGNPLASKEEEVQGIPILFDDISLYQWRGGTPQENAKVFQEGKLSFIPTGNNHFPLPNTYVIGNKEGEIRKASFYVYIENKNSCLKFQANINGVWGYRVAIDGRNAYGGGFGHTSKKDILNIAVKKWVKIDIDFIDDLGATEGSTLKSLAFSSHTPTLYYDNVQLHEKQ